MLWPQMVPSSTKQDTGSSQILGSLEKFLSQFMVENMRGDCIWVFSHQISKGDIFLKCFYFHTKQANCIIFGIFMLAALPNDGLLSESVFTLSV